MNLYPQRGFTLLELMAALGIGMMMLLGLTAVLDTSLQDVKGQQAGQYQAQFVAAATRYLNDQYATLLPNPTGSLTKSFVSLTDLQNAALLPASFATKNAYQQTPCMLLRKTTNNKIDALIVTEGGVNIPQADLSYVAANAGTGGGSIGYAIPGDNTSPRVARGIHGGWELTNAELSSFTSGNSCSGVPADLWHLASALFDGGGSQVQNDFLYRKPVVGNAQLNQMNTPIGMGIGATVGIGDTCNSASIAMSSNGDLLTCDLSSFTYTGAATSSWKAPVANYASLPLAAAAGDVHATLDQGRAYMYDGAGWLPLALDSTGSLTMEGDLTVAGNLSMTGLPTSGKGDITTAGNLTVNSIDSTGIILMGNAGFLLAYGKLTLTGIQPDSGASFINVSVDDKVQTSWLAFGQSFSAGDTCNVPYIDPNGFNRPDQPTGTLVKDAAGNILVCRATGNAGMFVYLLSNSLHAPPPPDFTP